MLIFVKKIGKTTLTNDAIKFIECHQKSCFIITEKFELNNSNEKPFQSISKIISNLISLILSENDLLKKEKMKFKIISKIKNISVLIDYVPEIKNLEKIDFNFLIENENEEELKINEIKIKEVENLGENESKLD